MAPRAETARILEKGRRKGKSGTTKVGPDGPPGLPSARKLARLAAMNTTATLSLRRDACTAADRPVA